MHGFSILRWGVLVALPLVVFPVGDSVREPKLFAMLAFSLVALGTLVLQRRRARAHGGHADLSAGTPWRAASQWPLPSLAFAVWATAQGLILRGEPLPVLALWGGLLLSWTAARAVTENPRHTRILLEGLTWFLLAFSLLQKFDLDPVFRHDNAFLQGLPTGFMGQHTLHAAWLAASASFLLGERRWLSMAAALFAMFLAGSTMATIGFLAALSAWVWLHPRWRRAAMGATAAGALILLVAFMNEPEFLQSSGRWEVWQKTARLGFERPFLGHGFHSFQEIFPREYLSATNHFWQQAHNEVLQVFFELGAVGVGLLSLLLAEIGEAWIRIKKNPPPLGSPMLPWFLTLTCLLVNSFGSFPWHMPPLAILGTTGFFVVTRPVIR